jgi:hypothetical protein
MSATSFCTLFDSRYLSRGLALYQSLAAHCPDFHLYVLAMDIEAELTLQDANLSNLTVIGLKDFENTDLLGIKDGRTRQEYCWTCTPAIIRYCLNTFFLSQCTYLDADIFFFDDPRLLLDELGDKSVYITPHNYHPDFDQSQTSGIYCVQFVTFKNQPEAVEVLETWYKNCISWCYARVEDGKFGDQKYLDSWPGTYPCVKVCENHGAGVAAWNIANYDLIGNISGLDIKNINGGDIYPVIFYHFHDFYFSEQGLWHHRSGADGYRITETTYNLVYKPYLKELFGIGKTFHMRSATDIPRVPQSIHQADFECTLIGRTTRQTDRDLLRSAYRFESGRYFLNASSATETDTIFSLFLDANLNLSRETLWHLPENLLGSLVSGRYGKFGAFESTRAFELLRSSYRKLRGLLSR